MISIYRKEIKYVLLQQEFSSLRRRLSLLMERDAYGGDFGYTVRSLYFDSIYDRDYYDTVDGLLHKAKVRLRVYGSGGPIKLELKAKEGDNSQKYSIPITREEADRMQAGDYGFLSLRPEPVAQLIHLRLLQGAYQPKTLVEYEREAYVFPAGDVRVTFDTRVRATAAPWDLFGERIPWTTLIPDGTGVLEVKYTAVLPSFIREALETGRQASANSKYVQARQLYQFGG